MSSSTHPKTRIVIAGPNESLRNGLRSILERQGDMEVIADAEDAASAVQLVPELKPDIVFVQLRRWDPGNTAVIGQILDGSPDTKVLVLSLLDDVRFVSAALTAGASGCVLTDRAFEELVDAVRVVLSDRTYISPGITGIVRED